MSTRAGLGRSLSSLIPDSVDTLSLVSAGETIEMVPVSKLHPDEEQPRTTFDQKALEELAASIARYGIVQPLVVTALSAPATGFRIIAGERRWRAAKLAGLDVVPTIVRSLKKQERLEIALIENVQRVDLAPLEQALSIEKLHQQFNLSYSDIAKRLGKAETTVSNTVRLLQLPEKARNALEQGMISEGHARQVLALKGDTEKQDQLVSLIAQHGWSVRQAEQYVTSVKAGHDKTTTVQKRMVAETPETKRLTKQFGVPVAIHRTAKGGRVELRFSSDQELERLLRQLAG
jgi:ParB family chromosome partitioning protein